MNQNIVYLVIAPQKIRIIQFGIQSTNRKATKFYDERISKQIHKSTK